MNDIPSHCPRCGTSLGSFTQSWFNTEIICIQCQTDEQQAPNYADAKQAEAAAVRRGNYNYPGIGLTEADLTVLAELRRQRHD